MGVGSSAGRTRTAGRLSEVGVRALRTAVKDFLMAAGVAVPKVHAVLSTSVMTLLLESGNVLSDRWCSFLTLLEPLKDVRISDQAYQTESRVCKLDLEIRCFNVEK